MPSNRSARSRAVSDWLISRSLPRPLRRKSKRLWRSLDEFATKTYDYDCTCMAHEARTDFAMLLGSIFLLIVGAGTWSLDARLGSKESAKRGDSAREQ